MNKDEIKKAFDICCDAQTQSCTGCPILELEKRNGRGCKYNMFISVFDLITEQENEIERLRTILGQCNTELNSALESLKSQCREIGELKAKVKQAKTDVLNELKEKYGFYSCYSWNCDTKSLNAIIDELIKEVQNDKCNG